MIHIPREEHGAVFAEAAQWLRPGGVLLGTLGSHDVPAGTDDDWRGVEMYWSSYDAQTSVALVGDAGFDVLSAEEVPQEEDGKIFSFLWVVGRSGRRARSLPEGELRVPLSSIRRAEHDLRTPAGGRALGGRRSSATRWTRCRVSAPPRS